ncbi:leucine-rich repeat domain-containing protein [Candidatus Uabimicrobium amorphum]|uniref:Disease resistance R13L4/SHOC-2-like LRR domain-containing protein n=1 Tax=Uabimicrobium amorphum TaxID=2596890 RepID=A0A5S9IIE6_UABAM|nr:leucine-rich repeat domain-containing protein [Candidatus Uabimicrobium amorphum]BBM82120.1 hypothetical protein UABAM_00463 [Candidatus Uabimicrobium amorphum]
MQKIKGQVLKQIQNDTVYEGCTFFLNDDKHREKAEVRQLLRHHRNTPDDDALQNVHFYHCSFRSDIAFSSLEGCLFVDCGFCGEFTFSCTTIPEYLYDFPITKLCLQNCVSVPPQIERLQQITALDMFLNFMPDIPVEVTKLRNLTSLILGFNSLHFLPEQITDLQNLQHLDLSQNAFHEFPEQILSLHNLTHLNLCANQLVQIPSLETLHNLIELKLQQNQLKLLPKLGKQNRLEYLDFSDNQISEISPDIFHMERLKVLKGSCNKIRHIFAENTRLQNLHTLDLSQNHLTEYSHRLCNLPHLTKLNLSQNNIKKIPPQVSQLKHLVNLDISHNSIAEVPEEIQRLDKLSQLNVDRNFISSRHQQNISSWLPKCKVDMTTTEKLRNKLQNTTGSNHLFLLAMFLTCLVPSLLFILFHNQFVPSPKFSELVAKEASFYILAYKYKPYGIQFLVAGERYYLAHSGSYTNEQLKQFQRQQNGKKNHGKFWIHEKTAQIFGVQSTSFFISARDFTEEQQQSRDKLFYIGVYILCLIVIATLLDIPNSKKILQVKPEYTGLDMIEQFVNFRQLIGKPTMSQEQILSICKYILGIITTITFLLLFIEGLGYIDVIGAPKPQNFMENIFRAVSIALGSLLLGVIFITATIMLMAGISNVKHLGIMMELPGFLMLTASMLIWRGLFLSDLNLYGTIVLIIAPLATAYSFLRVGPGVPSESITNREPPPQPDISSLYLVDHYERHNST